MRNLLPAWRYPLWLSYHNVVFHKLSSYWLSLMQSGMYLPFSSSGTHSPGKYCVSHLLSGLITDQLVGGVIVRRGDTMVSILLHHFVCNYMHWRLWLGTLSSLLPLCPWGTAWLAGIGWIALPAQFLLGGRALCVIYGCSRDLTVLWVVCSQIPSLYRNVACLGIKISVCSRCVFLSCG